MSTLLNSLISEVSLKLNGIRKAFPEIPALLLICDIKNRSGLSAISLGMGIISRLTEIGIPNGVNADGSPNLINKYTMLIAEEVVKEVKAHGLSLTVIEPGKIKIEGTITPSPTGGAFIGTNTNLVEGKGATI